MALVEGILLLVSCIFVDVGAETELQGEDEIGSSAGGCSGLIGQVFYNPIRKQGGQNPEQTAWQHNDSKQNDNG